MLRAHAVGLLKDRPGEECMVEGPKVHHLAEVRGGGSGACAHPAASRTRSAPARTCIAFTRASQAPGSDQAKVFEKVPWHALTRYRTRWRAFCLNGLARIW